MNQEKLKSVIELMGDDDFASKLYEAKSDEKEISLFREKGIELSKEELDELVVYISENIKDTEFKENELEAVVGGAGAVATVCIVLGGLGLCYVSGRIVGWIARKKLRGY